MSIVIFLIKTTSYIFAKKKNHCHNFEEINIFIKYSCNNLKENNL